MTITIYAGNENVIYARWVEFGTAAGATGQRQKSVGLTKKGRERRGRKIYRNHPGTSAQPFFFPAYRLMSKRAALRIKRAISKAVKEHWGKK